MNKCFALLMSFLIAMSSIAGAVLAADSTPPVVTQFDVPTTIEAYKSFNVTVTATDNVMMSYLDISSNASLNDRHACTGATCSKTWSTFISAPGAYSFKLIAADTSDNKAIRMKSITVTPDVTPPVLNLTVNPTSITRGQSTTITCAATDAAGIASGWPRIAIKKADGTWVNQTATSYTYTPNFTDPVGTYKVYCAAKDNNNNYGESAPTNLNVTAITGMTVTVTASGSVFNRGDTAIITADVKYPNGAPMTTGTVKATKPSPTPGGEISLSYGSGKWSKSYIIGTNDTTGTWTITTSADDGNGNRGTGTTSATISDKYTVSFIYPNTGSYKRGETVKIIVDVYDANSRKVTGATVNATKPVSGTITLYDDGNHDDGSANDGRYGNSYTIALTDPNSWTLTVTATKSGNTGTSQKIINILPAQLNVLITAPPAGSVYNRGETVPITAEITYPNGSPLTAGTVTATNPTGGTITMTHSSGPTWTGSYVIALTDPASIWTITVSAQDSGSNSGSAQRQVTISSAYTIIITSPGSGSKYHRGDSFVISAIVKDIHANPVSGANVIATVPNGTMVLNDIGGGSYSNTYTVQASDTTGIKTLTVTGSKDGNSGTDSRTIEVLADTKAPVYSYCQVTPMSGTTYAKGASYKFECTWDDDMVVSDVVFEFNGFAYSYLGGKIGKVGNVYSMILNDLPANVTGWEYKWSAKDNENNWNSTPTWNYVINKAPSTVSLTLSPPSPIVYGTPTTATCTDTNPEADAKLWRDGIDVTTTENGTAVVLPAGTREYACIVAETQNYTSASQMSSYDVGTRPNPVHIWINGKLDQDDTITYGTQSNVTGIATAGTADLWMDEAPVTNPHIATLAAGTYTYKVNTTGDLNYMANVTGIMRSLTVERVSSVIDLSVSPVTSTYGTLVTATCSQLAGDNGSTLTLLLDSNVVNTSTSGTVSHSVVASGGTHNYECYYAQTQNYTASTKSVSFTVNKAPVDVRLWLNGNEGNVTQNYGSNTNATATIDVSGLTFYLERNGSIIASGTDRLERTSSLNVGTYNYTAYFPGNENYTADSQTWFVTINPGIVNIDMYLNGIQNGNATQIYGTASNVTATITPNILFYLYRNGIQVDTGTSVLEDIATLAAGTYNYTAYFPGDTNYPAVSKTYFLRIEKATPVSAGNLIPASPITYGTPTTFQCNIGNTDSGVTYKLWYHDNSGGPWMELLNNTPEVYPAGEWLHYCNSTESENFTAAEFFTNVPYIVNKAMPTLTLLLNGTDSDYTMERGSSISIEATLSIPGDLHLLVNGSEIATGPSPLTTSYSSIMPGQHNITAVFEGNENYTAVSAQHWLTVQDTTAPIITILSPANTTYNMMSLDLNWTASEPLSWAGYSLDGAPNVTLTGNTSLTPGAGTHTITIYGTDNAGLTGSDSVTFTMECVSHIFNSTIDNTYYNNVHMNLYLPDSTIYCSNVNDSTIINTTMTNSTILRSYVKGKNLIGMWIEDSWVDPTYGNSSGYSRISADSNVTDSSVWYSNVTDRSNVYDSGVNYSSVTHSNLVTTLTLNSTIKESSISYSTVKSSVVTGSTIPNATLTNTSVTNTQFCANIEAMDAVIIDNRMTSGYIIYKGITYSTPTNITAMCSLMNNNDTVPPVINRIWNTTAVYAGQPADFSINATDNVGIANITVNGTLATWIGGDVWTNTINVPGSDGIYRWLVTAMDYAGNTADRYISINVNTSNDPNVTIDLNPPIIGPIFPTSATLNKPLNLSANVSDDTEVTNCTLFINGNPVANMTDSLPSASATVKANWTFGAIGDYAVHAGCYDAFDNWAEGIDVMVSVKEAVITGGGGGAGGPIWTPSITVNVHSPIIIDIGTTGVFTTHVSVSGMTDATNVQLTVSGVPYTYSVTPQSATIKAGSSETFTIYMVVPDTAQPGTNHIKIIATSAQGLTGSGEADLIIKMPGQMIENVTNQTNATQPVTPTTPTTPSGLAGALLAASTNPLTAIGVMLAVIGLLGWLWYKKPELFRRKKTDGGEA